MNPIDTNNIIAIYINHEISRIWLLILIGVMGNYNDTHPI